MTMGHPTSLAGIPLDRWLRDLQSSHEGLAEAEAQARLARYGPNDALARGGQPLAVQFLLRFVNRSFSSCCLRARFRRLPATRRASSSSSSSSR